MAPLRSLLAGTSRALSHTSPIPGSSIRALHLDPSPAAPNKPQPQAGTSSQQSSGTTRDTSKEAYNKGGTASEAYGNEDVEAAIRSAQPSPGQRETGKSGGGSK
ncbi:MAG: hypothetical protein M1822_007282 [Bathelium mastoideum]|nr:MAG: hypothetical protein M1822_007282 [Bathelium mastoideum]